jgi:hypothetical protein
MTEDTKTSVAPDTSKYQKVKSASGGASLNNGDEVAQALTGATLDEVYRLASKALGETQKALHEKYDHLNEGMQRMNLGNRIRGAVGKMNTAEEGSGTEFLAGEGAFIREAVAKREEAAAAEKAKAEKAAKAKAEAKPKKKKAKKAA